MKKLILVSAVIFSLSALNVNAAKNTEVYDYERASELGTAAFKNKSYDNAFKHLDKASRLGNKAAQYTLALLYMGGQGVKQDYTQAYLWLNVAAEVKHNKWRGLRDKIHNALSEEQRNVLQPLVQEHINKFGAKAQEVSCSKRSAVGSNIRVMRCVKQLNPEEMRL